LGFPELKAALAEAGALGNALKFASVEALPEVIGLSIIQIVRPPAIVVGLAGRRSR